VRSGESAGPRFIDICGLDDLEDRAVSEVVVAGRRAGAARVGEQVFVFGERCPHQGGPLSRGKLCFPLIAALPGDVAVDRACPTVACPWHGWEFRLDSGRALADASVRVLVYDVQVAEGRVLVRARGA
jgi:3-phenylpropionate/trans-cinnamate dioxygenase ferredoxin subunit